MEPEQVTFAAQLDPQLLADRTRAAVAAYDEFGADVPGAALGIAHGGRRAVGVLRQAQELVSVPDVHRRQLLRYGFEEGLQRVLGDELIRFPRHRAVVAGGDLCR